MPLLSDNLLTCFTHNPCQSHPFPRDRRTYSFEAGRKRLSSAISDGAMILPISAMRGSLLVGLLLCAHVRNAASRTSNCQRLYNKYQLCVTNPKEKGKDAGAPSSPQRVRYCQWKHKKWYTECYEPQFTFCSALCASVECSTALQAACDRLVQNLNRFRELHEYVEVLNPSEISVERGLQSVFSVATPDGACVNSERLAIWLQTESPAALVSVSSPSSSSFAPLLVSSTDTSALLLTFKRGATFV